MKTHLCLAAAIVLMTISLGAQSGLDYPVTRKGDHVDTYDGINVPDPYRWLEDDTSAETAKWVEAQNKVTFGYLGRFRSARRSPSDCSISTTTRSTAPSRKGQYFFFRKNDGLQPQSVLYIQRGIEGKPEVLLDPNQWSSDGVSPPDGTVILNAFVPSKDAKLAVYGISRSGSDWQEYNVIDSMRFAWRCSKTDSSTRASTCAAAANTVSNGTTPGQRRRSRTSSTISSPRRSG